MKPKPAMQALYWSIIGLHSWAGSSDLENSMQSSRAVFSALQTQQGWKERELLALCWCSSSFALVFLGAYLRLLGLRWLRGLLHRSGCCYFVFVYRVSESFFKGIGMKPGSLRKRQRPNGDARAGADAVAWNLPLEEPKSHDIMKLNGLCTVTKRHRKQQEATIECVN